MASSSLRSCFCGKFRLKSSCISVGCQRACFRKAMSIEGRELSLFASLQWGQFSAILTLPFHRCLQQKKQITHRTSFKFSCASTHDASRHDTRKFDIRDSTLTASLAWFLARAKSRWFPLVITPRARAQFKQACKTSSIQNPPNFQLGKARLAAWHGCSAPAAVPQLAVSFSNNRCAALSLGALGRPTSDDGQMISG